MMPVPRQRSFSAAFRGTVCFALAASLLVGCSSTKIYTAKSLPRNWHAVATKNIESIDLTKLASVTTRESQIAKGDVLEVTIAAGTGRDDVKTTPVRVRDDGFVDVLLVGPVFVDGLEFEEAEAVITQACMEKQIYRAPLVTVSMKRPKMNRVTVTGGVKTEGVFELRSGSSDVLQAIVMAGGLSKDAGTNVEVRHPGFKPSNGRLSPAIAGLPSPPRHGNELASHELAAGSEATSLRIDLASLGSGDSTQYELQDGAVVMVEKRDPPALQVLGLVKKPDRYEFPIGKNMRLLDAVSLAGGTTNSLADKVFLIRRREGHEPVLVQTSLRKAKRRGEENMLLEPGDTVSVEQTPATVFIDAVRMIGVNLGGGLF